MPLAKDTELFNRVSKIAENNDKISDLALARLKIEISALEKSDAASAFLLNMMLASMIGKREEIISFGRKVYPLLSSVEHVDVFKSNFVTALISNAIFDEWDVKSILDSIKPRGDDIWQIDFLRSTYKRLGYFDSAKVMYDLLTGLINHKPLNHFDPNEILVYEAWEKVKESLGVSEADLNQYIQKMSTEFFRLTKQKIKAVAISSSEEFDIFYEFLATLTVDELVDFSWDLTDIAIENFPVLSRRVIFSLIYLDVD